MNDDEGDDMETAFLVCFLIVVATLGFVVAYFKLDM
jgi:hypothetical protein